MSEFLIEVLSEEIPARMQKAAAEHLEKVYKAKLTEAGIEFGNVKGFSTPMRIGLVVEDLPTKVEDRIEEHRGPKIDAPKKAIEGFLKSKNTSLDACKKIETPKGEYWAYEEKIIGKLTEEVLIAISEDMIVNFEWPKSMRWSDYSLRWVRPINSVLAVFDGKALNITVPNTNANIVSSDLTKGHRFLAPAAINVTSFADYKEKLEKAFVFIERDDRRKQIDKLTNDLAKEAGLKVREDEALMEEVVGLVEYPNAVIGEFDKEFLEVPAEALIASMRGHQKYLALLDSKGNLSHKFLVVTNVPSEGKRLENIASGNEKVLRARLSDAKFFWDQDLKNPLRDGVLKLDNIVFHAKLGTLRQKTDRVMNLSEVIATAIGADANNARAAAELSKADLVSAMVNEFPDLQGIIGMYYAKAQGENAEVAQAINDHYKPVGAGDDVPTELVSVAVALADKIDTIAGFFAIGEKPTGSKDPYALRRAALGVIRIILQNKLDVSLEELFAHAVQSYVSQGIEDVVKASDDVHEMGILNFVSDRMKFTLKAGGVKPDLIEAVFASLEAEDSINLPEWQGRIASLQEFLETEDGANLLAGYKRAANIVRIEEKKDKCEFSVDITEEKQERKEEQELFKTLWDVQGKIPDMLLNNNFSEALKAMSTLRTPIDNFFDEIVVNDSIAEIRENRLMLLKCVEATVNQVAVLSLIK